MPSLKMKTKSSADSLRVNHGLHACQKSSKISKNSSSHSRNFQHEEGLDARKSKKQNDFFCNKTTVQDIKSDETNSWVDEILEVQKHLSPSSNAGFVCKMDPTQANFSSTTETIFSPILESIDNDIEPHIYEYGGRENDLFLPSCGDNDVDGTSRKSSEYQICNVSDFFISDMIVSSSCVERNAAYTGFTEATCLLDYECDKSSRFSADEHMLLPFLEDSIETVNHYEDSNVYSEPAIVSEDSSIYVAIHQSKSYNQESDINSYPDWDSADCLDPQMFIRNLLDLSEMSASFCPTVMPQKSRETKSITLVLDLDETLVHSSLEHCDDADFTFSLFSSLKEHTVYVKKRPYLRVFLERVSEMFHIVIFTASQSIYAKQLLDILDPDGKIISRRAYRESCIFADGSYTKDLTVLGVDLAKIVIIDNSPQVFRLQVNNGIPIKSWFDDPSDYALISLIPFLETLVDAEDVRPIIAKRFGNKE